MPKHTMAISTEGAIEKDARIEEMLKLNDSQAAYYDKLDQSGNSITRMWRFARRRTQRMRRLLQLDEALSELHRSWLGDLSDKKVLDLGAFSGNPLSLEIAANSKEYLAIDLSAEAIASLQSKIEIAGIQNAQARAIDFLSPDFMETFDVIYARSVLHHFRYFEEFLKVLRSKLNPAGFVISYDPMQTDLVGRGLRAIYRPFQTDKEWEWPFQRSTFDLIQEYFKIEEIAGSSGMLKWSFPLAILSPKLGAQWGQRLQQIDREQANSVGRGLYRCWQVSMKLTVRQPD